METADSQSPKLEKSTLKTLAQTVSPVTTGDPFASPLLCDGITQYKPVPAFEAPNYHKTTTTIVPDGDNRVKTDAEPWPSGNAARNKLLPNISTEISVRKLDGSLSVGPFINAKGTKQKITIDLMKYRSEPVVHDGNVIHYSRVGAGMRLAINIATTDASLGTGSLLAFAASASAGKTTGSITADVIGMDSSEVSLALPFTSDLSEKSILSVIEALAVIKSKLHEDETTLVPQFIANIECVKPTEVAKS